jgi:hypothetical protein
MLRDIEEGVEVGSEPCACGGCRPTATIYQGDPRYERHDPALAEGPCCCGRFFVVAADHADAEARAGSMAAAREGADAYRFEEQHVALPWGGSFAVVVGDLRA